METSNSLNLLIINHNKIPHKQLKVWTFYNVCYIYSRTGNYNYLIKT